MRRLKAASSVVIAGSPAVHVVGEHDDDGNRGDDDGDDCMRRTMMVTIRVR